MNAPKPIKPPTCACGAPLVEYCHECHEPLCREHVVTALLIAHCAACAKKHREPLAAAEDER